MCMNVTLTIAISCSVTISSSESLPNDGEKPNQHKSMLERYSHSGKTSAFCKHKSSSLHNQSIEMIYH